MKIPVLDLGVVMVAGGGSTRFGSSNKLLADLAGRPVFIHGLAALLSYCLPGNLVLVVPAREQTLFQIELERHLPGETVRLVAGGPQRIDSVRNGLQELPPMATWAAIHDAARPLADGRTLELVLAAARIHGGAVAARKVTDTLKEVDASGKIVRTVDRTPLWAVETPQIFRREELSQALAMAVAAKLTPTDDANAMEMAGYSPFLCEIRTPNPKITVEEDLQLIKRLMTG